MKFHPTTSEDLQTIFGWMGSAGDMVLWSGPTFTWPLTLDQLLTYAENPKRTYWSAVDGDSHALMGHASLLIDDDAGLMRIGFIIVNPALRGLGTGRSLVDGVVQLESAASTIPVMTLGVLAHNLPAIQLYKSLGFQSTGSISRIPCRNEKCEVVTMTRPATTA
ncbi:GNAT family N-acetyltransferase [Arthrobacter sp. TMS2-4]